VNAIYEATVKILGDELPLSTLQHSLNEGLQRLGKDATNVGFRDMEKVLKGGIYRQLQVKLPAGQAKNRIQQVIDSIAKYDTGDNATESEATVLKRQDTNLTALEDALKRFNLYFEWPEVQKFRAQINVIREQHAVKRPVPELIKDAQTQLGTLERKLSDLLVRQNRDVLELKHDLDRVRSVGGPRVKRLESLVAQLETSQGKGEITPAEVERARKLASELRKMVESSVVTTPTEGEQAAPTSIQAPAAQVAAGQSAVKNTVLRSDAGEFVVDDSPQVKEGTGEFLLDVEFAEDQTQFDLDFADLTPEQSERVLEIDLGEEARQLEMLEAEHRGVLESSADLGVLLAELQNKNKHDRVLLGAELIRLREIILERQAQMLEAQRARLEQIPAMLDKFESIGVDVGEARLTHSIASGMVSAKVLASDDLATLEDLLRTFERQFEARSQVHNEEQARLSRTLEKQDSFLEEMRSAQAMFAPLGSITANFLAGLNLLDSETKARSVREDLIKALNDEAQKLQGELERRLAAERAETERKALEERQRLEQLAKASQIETERVAVEAQAEVERAETERRVQAEKLAADRARESGILRGMRVAIASLPDLPDLSAQTDSLRARLVAAQQSVEAGNPLGANLETLQLALSELGHGYTRTFQERLMQYEARAQAQGASDVMQAARAARSGLEGGLYPDLTTLEAGLLAHRETRLNQQRRELAELETAAREYAVLPQSRTVTALTAQARAGHEAGQFLNLTPVWDQLEQLRIAEETALTSWSNRAETIIEETKRYTRMGGETVRQLVRNVEIMHTERAMSHISPETRLRLERSLEESEDLIAGVREEYAAANAVAAALKDTSMIDDLLGIFNFGPGATPAPTPVAAPIPVSAPTPISAAPVISSPEPESIPNLIVSSPEPSPTNVATTVSANPAALSAWLTGIAAERGVAHAVLIRTDGTLEFGQVHEPTKLAAVIGDVERYNIELSNELKRSPSRVYTLEFNGGAIVALSFRLTSGTKYLVVHLEDMASYSRIFAQAQRDYDELFAWSGG
jgi:chromosome segregation protein